MKLGVVGTGMIVRELLAHVLPAVERVRAVALCSTPRSLRRAQELGAQYGIPLVTDDFDTLLAADIDAIYLGVPNHLHASLSQRALETGKNVICEKPLTSTIEEAEALAALAHRKHVFLLEAISNQYQDSYRQIRNHGLPLLGEIKQVFCNFSQYSSRYDAFRRGKAAPAFDPGRSGGALMDLNIYNVYFVVGLFGAPNAVHYAPVIERGIDTSGVLTMKYSGFAAACIGAKSCSGPSQCLIEGTSGYLTMQGTANWCGGFSTRLRGQDGSPKPSANAVIASRGDDTDRPHRMVEEFVAFERIMRERDFAACDAALDKSLLVSRILTQARRDAGVLFPADAPFVSSV